MSYFRRPLGLIFLILMVLMAAQIALKPPLCIDSRLVNKIDSPETESAETVFACRQFKLVPFSSYFYRHLPEIERQLRRAETALLHLKTTKKINAVNLKLKPEDLQNGK